MKAVFISRRKEAVISAQNMVTSNRQAGHEANPPMVVGKVQNHRMGVVGRGLWRLSCPLTLLRQRHLEQGAQDHVLSTKELLFKSHQWTKKQIPTTPNKPRHTTLNHHKCIPDHTVITYGSMPALCKQGF